MSGITSEEYYKKLNDDCNAILIESLHSKAGIAFKANHNYLVDMERWVEILSSRPEINVLKGALREYHFALLVILQGHYRQAFMSLRLFMELYLSSIHFSANELHLRLWLNGKQDINWNAIINDSNGVLSKNFAEAFYEELADDVTEYRVIAEKLYRECSEYVHGNAYTHNIIPDCIRYDEEIFINWNEKARNIRLLTSFAICVRYLKHINKENIKFLEPFIIHELGHISSIRGFLGGVTGE